jgi:hypothetical protein
VPWDFQEEVARARATARRGDLRLLADEAQSFEWGVEGLRVVGEAQFQIGAFTGARETFEAMRRAVPDDFLANFRLGTIYQRLARSAATSDAMLDLLVRSDQAIARVLERTRPPAEGGEAPAERSERRFYRAEAHSLLGSNAKTRWMDEWQSAIGEARRVEALRAPGLGESLQHYLNGYAEDLDSYYPGINALALLKIQIELAKSLPEVWAEGFDDDMKAAADLEQRGRRALRTAAALELALGIDEAVATSEQSKPDIWKAISAADLLFLTVERPQRIGNAYRKALADAQPFEVEAVRRNILLFKDLALLTPNVEAALGAMQQGLVAKAASVDQRPARVVLFTGHMIDAPGRPKDKARFPPTPEAERTARGLIEEALRVELQEADGTLLGMAGGACGSDILFHEICESLGIGTRLFLALPEEEFLVTSVSRGGPDWVERYRRLCSRVPPRVLADSKDLPRWLADRRDYDIWQRNNLWMMFNALAEEARTLTLIALYNPEREPDGPGGTRHLIEVASKWGFKPVALDARALLKS